ncbi:MAG: hypothetical protein L6V93_21215 [Clostridiales bacterium]|nr:MAG: hypothetical protein L6V93_21215 [Clostridiales bacterium]
MDVFEIFCDIGKNDDRKIAQMCGLGFYGINSLIINEDYGSYFFHRLYFSATKILNIQRP